MTDNEMSREIIERALRRAMQRRLHIADTFGFSHRTVDERLRMADRVILEAVRRLQLIARNTALADPAALGSFERYAERTIDMLETGHQTSVPELLD